MQLKIRELELAAATPTSASRCTEFDVSKQIQFVPPFQEAEVDKYFLHFEKIASSLEWPKEMWTLLLQSVLLRKVRDAYSTLSVDHNSDYDVVKSAILKAYELVPRHIVRNFEPVRRMNPQCTWNLLESKKHYLTAGALQRKLVILVDLRQLVLLEEFKSCLPLEIQAYLDEQKVDTLHQATVRADDYSLMHKMAFGKNHPQTCRRKYIHWGGF